MKITGKITYEKIVTAGICLLVSVIPFIISSKVVEIAIYPKLIILNVIILVLTGIWLINTLGRKEYKFRSSPLLIPVIFYLIINFLSIRLSVNINASLMALSLLIPLIILFFIVINGVNVNTMTFIFKIAVISGSVSAIIGVSQYLGIGFLWIPSTGFPSSTFAYRNMAAMYMIMIIPIGLWIFLIETNIKNEVLWGILTSIMVLFLLYTRTRGAWVGLSGAVILLFGTVYSLKIKKKEIFQRIKTKYFLKKKILISLPLLSVIFLMGLLPPSEKARQDLGGIKAEGLYSTAVSIITDSSGRLKVWSKTLDMLGDNLHWLTGVGLNNFELYWPKYSGGFLASSSSHLTRPHNDFLWILSETGIMGLIIYCWLLITVYWMTWKIIRYSFNLKFVLAAMCILTSITAILGHSFFSFPKERITPSMLFWIFIGFIGIIYNSLDNNHRQLKTITRHFVFKKNIKYGITIGVLCLSFLAVLSATEISRRYLIADYHFLKAHQYLKYKEYGKLLKELKKGEKWGVLNYWSVFLKGIGFTNLGMTEEAIIAFQNCLQQHPNHVLAHYRIGILYSKTGDLLNAIKHYSFSTHLNPDFSEAHYNLAVSLHRLGVMDDAEKEYKEAIRSNPKLAAAYNNLGVLVKDKNNLEEAIGLFAKAVDINPDYQEAKINLLNTQKEIRSLSIDQ